GKTVPDVIAPDLKLLLVGINPGLYTAAIGHHFGRPGNRFWPTLHQAGFTPRQLSPFEENELLDHGIGITNIVNRATARADELTDEELREGAALLAEKVKHFRPRVLAFLGVTSYRTSMNRPKAKVGRQPDQKELFTSGEESPQEQQQPIVWVLPNPSGLN